MYYCDQCRIKYKWPLGDKKKSSPGPCEHCFAIAPCTFFDATKYGSESMRHLFPHPDRKETAKEVTKDKTYFGLYSSKGRR